MSNDIIENLKEIYLVLLLDYYLDNSICHLIEANKILFEIEAELRFK